MAAAAPASKRKRVDVGSPERVSKVLCGAAGTNETAGTRTRARVPWWRKIPIVSHVLHRTTVLYATAEKREHVHGHYVQEPPDGTRPMPLTDRAVLFAWMMEAAHQWRVPHETFWAATRLVDRYMDHLCSPLSKARSPAVVVAVHAAANTETTTKPSAGSEASTQSVSAMPSASVPLPVPPLAPVQATANTGTAATPAHGSEATAQAVFTMPVGSGPFFVAPSGAPPDFQHVGMACLCTVANADREVIAWRPAAEACCPPASAPSQVKAVEDSLRAIQLHLQHTVLQGGGADTKVGDHRRDVGPDAWLSVYAKRVLLWCAKRLDDRKRHQETLRLTASTTAPSPAFHTTGAVSAPLVPLRLDAKTDGARPTRMRRSRMGDGADKDRTSTAAADDEEAWMQRLNSKRGWFFMRHLLDTLLLRGDTFRFYPSTLACVVMVILLCSDRDEPPPKWLEEIFGLSYEAIEPCLDAAWPYRPTPTQLDALLLHQPCLDPIPLEPNAAGPTEGREGVARSVTTAPALAWSSTLLDPNRLSRLLPHLNL